MLPLNHKRTTSSLAPPIFYVTKKIGYKLIEGSPFLKLTLRKETLVISGQKMFWTSKEISIKNIGVMIIQGI